MNKLKYLNHIDALRAIAVLVVVLFHLDITLLQGGFIGVDVFFVISGFLITRILTYEFNETKTIDFKKFYARRARRLMPSLFLTLLLVFSVSVLLFSPSDLINAMRSMAMSSVALSNLFFLGESGYFDVTSAFKPLLHTWSLGIEEQFYVLYPISLLLLLRSKKKRGVLNGLLIVFGVSFIYTLLTSLYGISPFVSELFLPVDELETGIGSLHFYLLPFRLFEFLLGAIIVFLKPIKVKSKLVSIPISVFGIGLIVLSSILFSEEIPFLSTLNIIPCFGAFLLLYFPPSKELNFLFRNKLLIHTGKISYTLYLIHWIVIVFYRYACDGAFTINEQLLLFISIYALSTLIWKYYETPLRYTHYRSSIKSNRKLVFLIAMGTLIAFSIRFGVVRNEGWLWRLSDKNRAFVEKVGDTNNYHLNNWGGASYNQRGLLTNGLDTKGIDFIWIGDSHAGHYAYGIDSILVKKNKKSVYLCADFSSLKLPDIVRDDRENYAKMSADVFLKDLKILQENPKAVVVLSHMWDSHLSHSSVLNDETGKFDKIPINLAGYRVVADKILKLTTMVENRTFVIIGPGPSSGINTLNNIEKILRPKYFGTEVPDSTVFAQNHQEMNVYLGEYFQTYDNIHFIDPSFIFCTDSNCLSQNGTKIFFSDNSHMSKEGSLRAMVMLENYLLSILNNN